MRKLWLLPVQRLAKVRDPGRQKLHYVVCAYRTRKVGHREIVRPLIIGSNNEVERRGASPASNEEITLSQSSIPSFAQRR